MGKSLWRRNSLPTRLTNRRAEQSPTNAMKFPRLGKNGRSRSGYVKHSTIVQPALLLCCHSQVRYPERVRAVDDNQIGKFQVMGTLGTGAHSTILHIRRSADAKHYALKVVPIGGSDDLKYLEQARYEFRVAQMLDHPNLIQIYIFEVVKDWLFRPRKAHLLLEYVNGKTLDNWPRLSSGMAIRTSW